jgi:sugar phosphate isomerase/epimerase
MTPSPIQRRAALEQLGLAIAAASLASKSAASLQANETVSQQSVPRHLLSSSLFGYSNLSDILPIAKRLGIQAIDVWPKVHGNQREQLTEMGEAKFAELLASHECKLECLTQYPLGPFGLGEEMRLAKRLGCGTIVTGSGGPKGLTGEELKQSLRQWAEKMKPHLELAHQCDVTIAIENHANSLLDSPDSIRWFQDFRPSERLAIAFAPYHLPQDEAMLSALICDVLPSIEVFYAWQHGKGCMQAQPKEDEQLQLPGRGNLDFAPLLAQLKKGSYSRWTEVFMHPFPRGVPIAERLDQVSELLAASKAYVDQTWNSAVTN